MDKNSDNFEVVYEGDCPLKKALKVIGGKWKIYIIRVLMSKDVLRYNELKTKVNGITDMMLSQSLKGLEKDRIITRTQYNEIPPRVEYSLTENGRRLTIAIEELSKWAREQED